MNKEQWIKENLQPDEQYGGLMLGKDGAPDVHLVVVTVCRKYTMKQLRSLASQLGAVVPTPNELMHLYLTMPDLFRTPPDNYNGFHLRRFWSGKPATMEARSHTHKPNLLSYWGVGPEAMNLSAVLAPDTYDVCLPFLENEKLDAVLIRRIPLGEGNAPATDEDTLPDWLLQLDARLKERGFTNGTVSFTRPPKSAPWHRTLQWRGSFKDETYDIDLVCQNAGPFAGSPWRGFVKWNILEVSAPEFCRIFTDEYGYLQGGDQLVEDITKSVDHLAKK